MRAQVTSETSVSIFDIAPYSYVYILLPFNMQDDRECPRLTT